MIEDSSAILSRPADERFFYPENQVERLLQKLAEQRDEIEGLRTLVISICCGSLSPKDGLVIVGADPDAAERLAAEIPSAREIETIQQKAYESGRHRAASERKAGPVHGHVVYYVLMNGLVKIGTTSRFEVRMRSMYVEPHDVLAVEPGGLHDERSRHEQFAHLRVPGRELFRSDPELRDHILSLRSENADPWAYGVRLTAAPDAGEVGDGC